ncbi:MAG TPA: porin [Albidovulum sp.]|uniref:porin n=1 Tax=Albidovulum sp. TaxID=1872424 RepID=UPI002C49B962|nr:porin [Albidovulum sp.]
MKKLLLASTALLGFASVAAAETGVTISGFGRFGLTYQEDRYSDVNSNGIFDAGDVLTNQAQVHTRLRFNIDATTETDSGVTFGGRIRIQDSNDGGAGLSPALLYVSYEGLRVEVGNANTAFDSAALLYDSELGLVDSSFGDSRSSFFSFATDSYSANRMGVFASYTMSGFSGKISFITPDQTTSTAVNEEVSVALSYESDLFSASAAAAQDASGIAGNDVWFIGGAYKGLPNTVIGLNYIDEGIETNALSPTAGASLGSTVVLYANYVMGATTLKGYVANNDYVANATDTSFGIGADYDLGGAKLTGGVQRGYDENMYADFGVRFDF